MPNFPHQPESQLVLNPSWREVTVGWLKLCPVRAGTPSSPPPVAAQNCLHGCHLVCLGCRLPKIATQGSVRSYTLHLQPQSLHVQACMLPAAPLRCVLGRPRGLPHKAQLMALKCAPYCNVCWAASRGLGGNLWVNGKVSRANDWVAESAR